LCRYAYESQLDLEVRVARIFNTFGPRMHPNDGRVVSNFIIQVSVCCDDIFTLHLRGLAVGGKMIEILPPMRESALTY